MAGVSEILYNFTFYLWMCSKRKNSIPFFAAHGQYFDTNSWRETWALRSEAWNLDIYRVGALGIWEIKLTLIEFDARWICVFHNRFPASSPAFKYRNS
jgi:hypothetical protein